MAGRGEFINGTRLVYPMEGEAMPVLNNIANRGFRDFVFLSAEPDLHRHPVRDQGAVAARL